uniref:Uncharacterized protein n=1 Tax=Acrobeloides nanus TaxID=290746 RepID=A0A914DQ18_9BILA
DVVNSFHILLKNNYEHTDAQIEAKVQEWLKKQTPELRAKYDKFVEENKKRDKVAEEAHARSVTKLSAEAKEADKKLWK